MYLRGWSGQQNCIWSPKENSILYCWLCRFAESRSPFPLFLFSLFPFGPAIAVVVGHLLFLWKYLLSLFVLLTFISVFVIRNLCIWHNKSKVRNMKETQQSKSCSNATSSGLPFVSVGKPYVYYLQLWANHCQRRDCKRKQQSKVLGTLQCSARGTYCFDILPLLLQSVVTVVSFFWKSKDSWKLCATLIFQYLPHP